MTIGVHGQTRTSHATSAPPPPPLYIAMIPKADGDSTPLRQRPLSVLPVVYRLRASLRLGHLREWVLDWVPQSVFRLGNGLSSVEAWCSTALDVEEVLAGIGSDQLHVMVADVIKSFDTVDRSILDCASGRFGLPAWFRKVYFSFHSQVYMYLGVGDWRPCLLLGLSCTLII